MKEQLITQTICEPEIGMYFIPECKEFVMSANSVESIQSNAVIKWTVRVEADKKTGTVKFYPESVDQVELFTLVDYMKDEDNLDTKQFSVLLQPSDKMYFSILLNNNVNEIISESAWDKLILRPRDAVRQSETEIQITF